MEAKRQLVQDSFPRSNQYHPDWVMASASGGANALWLTEWLCSALDLRSGMRVLDLGCGRSASSIFLAREFDANVWAADLWFSPSENLLRIRDAELEHQVFPMRIDARSLPFANDFFDVVLSIDAFPYFGTDQHYLEYLARFLKPGGILATAGAGLVREIDGPVPEHLQKWWGQEPALWSLHSPAWWSRHWEQTGLVEVEKADTMPQGWRYWLEWHHLVAPDNKVEIQALESDRGQYLGYVRMVARLRSDVKLEEPIVSIPAEYLPKPLLREDS